MVSVITDNVCSYIRALCISYNGFPGICNKVYSYIRTLCISYKGFSGKIMGFLVDLLYYNTRYVYNGLHTRKNNIFHIAPTHFYISRSLAQ